MERLIKVKGIGNVRIKPDLIIIDINLSVHKNNYNETMKIAVEYVDILRNSLEKIGIDKKDLKLEFDLDMEKLSRVISSITLSDLDPRFNVRFSIKDKYSISDDILIKATENARRKAEILVRASNEKLGDLVTIDYNFSDVELYSATRYDIKEKISYKEESYSPNVEPEDINISDTVTFVWKIK